MSKKLTMTPTALSLPLPDWIRSARLSLTREDYLECALTIALKLTNSLCDNFELAFPFDEKKANHGIASSSLLFVKVEDVVPENVQVFFAKVDDNYHFLSRANFMATEVIIQPTVGSKPQRLETPQLQLLSRDVCFSLGKILFMLFAQGDLIEKNSPNTNNDVDLLGALMARDISLNEDSNALSSALKRPYQLDTNPNLMCANANAILREKGLPLSVCQLVSDLLESEKGNQFISSTALLSLEETRFDFMCMKTHPERFLYDHTCPTKARESTALFTQNLESELYGRKEEMRFLMDTVSRVSMRVQFQSPGQRNSISREGNHGVEQVNDFLCEAIFLSGHSGSGKSSLINQTLSSCAANGWFVILCKFDHQVAPLSALLQSFDNFFGHFVRIQGDNGQYLQRVPSVQASLDRITRAILSSIDMDSFSQLCDLLPNASKLFPLATDYAKKTAVQNGSVGSGTQRLFLLLHIIFRAVCSCGPPVVICAEDLHWADAFTMDILGHFAQAVGHSSVFSTDEESPQQGFLLLGSFRNNEVDEDGFLMKQIKNMEQSYGNIQVSRMHIDELSVADISSMLSFKFFLPVRHTRGLAQLVHHKTRGNPLYIVEFLRLIIQQNLMTFSVKSRRWTWDDNLIDQQMMSEGVVELLTTKLRHLPGEVIGALKVASCLGSQVNISTIELLDLGQFVPDMLGALELAVQAGIVEKAGSILTFSHDMLRESAHNLIPLNGRKTLHRRIGTDLAIQDPLIGQNAELCIIAVDQINMCKDVDGILNPAERSSFARLNLAAGRHSISCASYEQARGYFEAGISLLHSNNWSKQYPLSLELYEMSVVASCMGGKVDTVSSRLDVILSNAKSFDDTLNAQALRAKFLASQEQYAEATKGVLGILSSLGEDFPLEIDKSQVINEIEAARARLKDTTKEKIMDLPKKSDAKKAIAMKFMALLLSFSNYASPLLAHLLSCRMIKLTFQLGFFADSITGMAVISHGLLLYSDDIGLARKICRITESLISENANEHSLRARLTQWACNVKIFAEPVQATTEASRMAYNSAKIIGDVDNACLNGLIYCIGAFYCTPDLIRLQKVLAKFLHEMTACKRIAALHSTMSYFMACTAFIEEEESCSIDDKIEMKTNEILMRIAEQSRNTYLMHHAIINQMHVHFYFREYLPVTKFAEKYEIKDDKRTLDSYHTFNLGISSLCLARDTRQEKWRKIGEKSVEAMEQLAEWNAWTFENKLNLLQAELHYLNGRHVLAELSYNAAIVSARAHKFIQEEALACELFGIYLLENKKVMDGLAQLQAAIDKYKQWGARKKADDVKEFIEFIHQPCDLLTRQLIGAEFAVGGPHMHYAGNRSGDDSIGNEMMSVAENNGSTASLIVLATLAEVAEMDAKRKRGT